jgi:hypothetical protein
MKKGIVILILSIFAFHASAQSEAANFTREINGMVMKGMIGEKGDTLWVVELEDVSVNSVRKFKSSKERRHYLRMKTYSAVVYPYAVEAIQTFRALEATTNDLKKRNRKQYIKQLEKELEHKFKAPLKNLSQTQVFILIKMIERELEMPVYDIVKNFKGSFSANYWNTFGKIYNVDIKQGYNPKDDPILELLLSGMRF